MFELRQMLDEEAVAVDKVMGDGVVDFVAGSIILYNACYFFNKLVDHELKYPLELKLNYKEMEQLSLICMEKFLKIERERFEQNMVSELKKQPLFRRLEKKSKDIKNKIKDIES